MHFGRDWTLTLLSCLILYLKLLHKYWIQRLLDHDHHSQLCMPHFVEFNLKLLSTYNIDHLAKRPSRATKRAVAWIFGKTSN